MKKILSGILFFAVFANSATINQSSVIGNWTFEKSRRTSSSVVSLEADTMKLTSDWKLKEVSIYSIDYPDYGPQKINLTYRLRITVDEGEYRLSGSELQKYPKNPTIEIEEGTMSDAEAAQNSRKEIEKLIKEEYKNFMPILHISDTKMELQATNTNLKFTKPKSLPVSKLNRASCIVCEYVFQRRHLRLKPLWRSRQKHHNRKRRYACSPWRVREHGNQIKSHNRKSRLYNYNFQHRGKPCLLAS